MSFRHGSMSSTEREARAALEQERVFDAALVRGLLDDIDFWREIATEDMAKWSFDALLAMAKRMLGEVYPDTVFTFPAASVVIEKYGQDSGVIFVGLLRTVIQKIEEQRG